MLHGTDISGFQPDIVPAGDFVIIKATEGTSYVSGSFVAQLADARRKGMLVGFYHFGHPGNDPVAEAEHFYATVRSNLKADDIVVLDHEVSDGTSPAHCASWAKQWLERVQARTGKRPVVYTYLSFANEGRCAGLGGYPLWIAHYTTAGHPSVPAPWTKWTLHQYTDTPEDKDVLNGDRSAWPAGTAPAPTPETEDTMLSGNFNLAAGEQYPILWDHGRFKGLAFWADTSFNDPANEVAAEASQKLRVAVLDTAGNVLQVEHITVGRAPGDKNTVSPTNITLKSPASANCASVTREDAGTKSIAFCLY